MKIKMYLGTTSNKFSSAGCIMLRNRTFYTTTTAYVIYIISTIHRVKVTVVITKNTQLNFVANFEGECFLYHRKWINSCFEDLNQSHSILSCKFSVFSDHKLGFLWSQYLPITCQYLCYINYSQLINGT